MKIAVMIAGPFRFTNLVLKNLEETLDGLDYDFFTFVWKQDLGNKKREQIAEDWPAAYNHPRMRSFIVQEPFAEGFYKDSIGVNTNSGSTINATMGMFYSMSTLCKSLEMLPNSKEYTHVLRMRTDCLLYNSQIRAMIESLKSNEIIVSENPQLPSEWISDHLCFGETKKVFDLWKFDDIDEIYQAYKEGDRNPENTLIERFKKKLAGVKLRKEIIRYRDYQIVYSPCKDLDPEWVKQSYLDGGVENLYSKSNDPYTFGEYNKFVSDFSENFEKMVQKHEKNMTIIEKIKRKITGLF